MTGSIPENTIAFILKGYPRLSETFIVNEILNLESLGFRLHIFAMRNPGESKIHESVRRVRAGVTYIPDHFWRHLVDIVGANLRLWRRSPDRYWREFRFALLRSLRQRSSSTIKRFSQAAYLVEKHLQNSEIDYLHAHFSHGPTTVAYFAHRLTGLPYSFSAHAKDIYIQEADFFRRKISHARFVVTCTEFNRRHLCDIAPHRAQTIHCVYHGVDTERFRPELREPRRGDLPQILSIGRFVPKKGFTTLLQALSMVQRAGFHFRCTLIGGGPLEKDLRRLCEQLGLTEVVHILGKMPQEALFPYYQRADIFALACEILDDGDRDGIPNVLVEAMAMGIPVVSTRISGIPELVDHGISGLLVPEKQPQELARALIQLLESGELREAMGTAARRRVEQAFDARKNITRLAALLRQAAGVTAEAGKTLPATAALPNLDTAVEAVARSRHSSTIDS